MNLLKCFELASGLKVNVHKSSIFGIGVDEAELNVLANHMGCQVGKFPFIYLGLPIGSRMRKLNDWIAVVEKFNNRLLSWKARSTSFGGWVVLIKLVLTSLPLYYFSLFRAPPTVIKYLESVRRNFFWGGLGLGSKISWVKWENVINSFWNGGLNIGSLKSKNLVLLGKWWWRFKTEADSLWVKVIRSIYGSFGGLLSGNVNSHSPKIDVWHSIIQAGTLMEDLQVRFKDSLSKKIGDGGSTSFWHEHWIGEDKLSKTFPRLFKLDQATDVMVKDKLVFDEGGTNFIWS
ncbi:uncharacterized mitochondrial protein AtMg00310-like [Rutidosis leptorrhynchoides]|uniref:uncharacterized mitochondrial protein AtMg00310-like n=1 Tax=Rutidosis leptorrhynchoides TaxID=125765 RepID=UPI003A98F63C